MKVALLLAGTVLAAASATAQTTASGTLTQNGKTVELRSALAVWDPAEHQLRVGLFPFVVNREDAATMRSSGAMFVATDHPSLDPSKWTSSPFAELVIEFAPSAQSPRREDVTHYELHVSWLDQMNFTLSPNRNM